MPKRAHVSDSDSYESEAARAKKSKSKTTAARPPLYKATAIELADGSKATSSNTNVDSAILERIKKCLARGNHQNTTENEAKAALFIASKLMAQHNVTQAEVMETATEAEKSTYAGRSIVSVRHSNGSNKKVLRKGFTDDVIHAINKFFDCQSYRLTRSSSIDYVFYGISQNTVSAAMSFEMVWNLISEWAKTKKTQANSYSLGVARGLWLAACEEKEEELRRAKQAEIDKTRALAEGSKVPTTLEPKRTEEVKREAANDAGIEEFKVGKTEEPDESDSGPEADVEEEEDDDEDDGGVPFGDFMSELMAEADFKEEDEDNGGVEFDDVEDEIDHVAKKIRVKCESPAPEAGLADAEEKKNQVKSESPVLKADPEDAEEKTESAWKSQMQLTVFRENAKQIADQYLEKSGVKLGKPSRRPRGPKDLKAYSQGKDDSRKIDVRRKRIKEEEAAAADGNLVKAIEDDQTDLNRAATSDDDPTSDDEDSQRWPTMQELDGDDWCPPW